MRLIISLELWNLKLESEKTNPLYHLFVTVYKDGQPCDHKGCLHHITHKCEGCGRKMARGEYRLPKWLINGTGYDNSRNTK